MTKTDNKNKRIIIKLEHLTITSHEETPDQPRTITKTKKKTTTKIFHT